MRPFTETISLDEARHRLESSVRPIERTEQIDLARAAGRVVAEDVVAGVDVPAFDRAAMDGYAVVARDTVGATPGSPVSLALIERIHAGRPSGVAVASGTCAEIATGAPLPAGADAVVMVEDTSSDGGRVLVRAAVEPGRSVGRRGADIVNRDIVLRRGDVLTPSRLGAIAAIGEPSVTVFSKPRVAILSTGNEVVEPGLPLANGQVHDVNQFTLGALVESHGGVAQPHRAARDTIDSLADALDRFADADLIVFSGGSSVGTRDLVRDIVAARGRMIFHGVAVKPGKPTAFALIGDTPFFGLPGNPTSCLSNAYILLVPFLRATARLPRHEPRVLTVPLGRRITSAVGRHQFYTVRVIEGVAQPAFKGSGEITSLSQADGYIEIPATRDVVEEGSLVEVTIF